MSSFISNKSLSRDNSNVSSNENNSPTYSTRNSSKTKKQSSIEEEVDLTELQRG